jgi:PST family polysaccharide transporter
MALLGPVPAVCFPSVEVLASDPVQQSLQRGTRTVIVMQLVSQLVTLVVLAVLYRVLGPEPYGLLAMVVPLLLLLRVVISGGLDVAAVQRADLSGPQVSALFWLNQILGVATVVVALAVAPGLAWFFNEPRLVSLTAALGGTSLVVALGTQHQALLQREMRLGTLAVIRVTAQAIGGAAGIAAAWRGAGVWALVVQQYVEFFALTVLAWLVEPWRPQFVLRRAGTRGMIRFGGHYTLSGLMFFVASNADKVIIGYTLGEKALGLYSQAFNLMNKPVQAIITPLTGLMLPSLSRAAGNPAQYSALLLGFFRAIALVMLPAAVGLSIVANEAMTVLGGPQWSAAGPLLAALALSMLVQGFVNVFGSVLASVGRADRLFYASAQIAVVTCAGLLAGLEIGRALGHPALGVAEAYSFIMVVVVFPPYLVYVLRTIGLPWQRWLAEVQAAARPAIGMGVILALIHWGLGRAELMRTGFLLVTEILLGVALYGLLARREIARLLALLGKK